MSTDQKKLRIWTLFTQYQHYIQLPIDSAKVGNETVRNIIDMVEGLKTSNLKITLILHSIRN